MLPVVPVVYQPTHAQQYRHTARDFCFTEFQFGDDYTRYARQGIDAVGVKVIYVCYQVEACPTSGRPHLQGYVKFSSAIRYRQAGSIMGTSTAHFEKRRGTVSQAIAYCQKRDTRLFPFVEFGIRPAGQGSRADLERVAELLRGGSSLRVVAETMPATYIRYSRGIRDLAGLTQSPPLRPNIFVCVLIGSAGSGKTRFVYERYPNVYKWPVPQNSASYASDYGGETVVLLDDFRNWLPFHLLLTICDRYPTRVNTLGAVANFNAELIFITSTDHPMEWYSRSKYNYPSLERRISIFNLDVPADRIRLDSCFPPFDASMPTIEEIN